MATINTTTSIAGTETSLPRVGRGTYNRELLDRAMPLLCIQKFGQTKSLGLRKGQSMVFRRYDKLAQNTIPLQEGVTPAGISISKTDVVATLEWYGNFATITDKVDLTSVDPTITETSALMGENMGESVDTVHWNALSAGTNWIRVQVDDGGTVDIETATVARDTVAGVLCKTAIDAAIRSLDGADGKHFTPMIPGSTKIATEPLGKAYWGVIHTDQIHDLFTSRGGFTTANAPFNFTPVEKYASHGAMQQGEVGKYRNVRFVATTNAKVWADSGDAVASEAAGLKSTTGTDCDVYCSYIFARDAYGIVPLAGNSAKIIVKSAKSGGTGDPLEQRNTVAWKAITCPAVILNETWMVRVECGSTA